MPPLIAILFRIYVLPGEFHGTVRHLIARKQMIPSRTRGRWRAIARAGIKLVRRSKEPFGHRIFGLLISFHDLKVFVDPQSILYKLTYKYLVHLTRTKQIFPWYIRYNVSNRRSGVWGGWTLVPRNNSKKDV